MVIYCKTISRVLLFCSLFALLFSCLPCSLQLKTRWRFRRLAGSANLCIVLFISGSFSTIKQQRPILLRRCDNTMWFGSNCIWMDCKKSLIYSPFFQSSFLQDGPSYRWFIPFHTYRTPNKTSVSLRILCLNVKRKKDMSKKKGVSHFVTFLLFHPHFLFPFLCCNVKERVPEDFNPCHLCLMRSFGLRTNENLFIPLLSCCEKLRREREVIRGENASTDVK